MARIFKPQATEPFACLIDRHGRAWNNGDLHDRTGLRAYLAERRRCKGGAEFSARPERLPDDACRHQSLRGTVRVAVLRAREHNRRC